MYRNLNAEMSRFNIKQIDLQELLDVTQGTMSLKLTGKSIITIDEAKKIRDLINSKSEEKLSLDYLFEI